MAGLGSLYNLIKAGGALVASAAAAAGQSAASVVGTLGSRFLAASASAINSLGGAAVAQANAQAFPTGVQPAATGYFAPAGTGPLALFGPHQYAWTAHFVDPTSGQPRTLRGYYGSNTELSAAQLRANLYPEFTGAFAQYPGRGGGGEPPPENDVTFEVRGYYRGV